MAEFPALPIFTDALIADTVHLTPEEFGCYMRLLIFAWRTAECRLPNNDLRLRTMLGLTPKRWERMKPTLMAFFIEVDDDLIQKKLSKVRRGVAEKVAQKRDAGERSAAARALLRNKLGPTSVATGSAGALQRGVQQPKPNLSKDKGQEAFFLFWEGQIKEGSRVPTTALTASHVRELVSRENVTKDQLIASKVDVK
jgi:uncharacterized protein YdaU (DUF1376 family)